MADALLLDDLLRDRRACFLPGVILTGVLLREGALSSHVVVSDGKNMNHLVLLCTLHTSFWHEKT